MGLLLFGCQDVASDDESVAQIGQAVSVCNESVPADRIVDGIPAYSQCADSRNAAIYSNNGVDTATSAVSSEWKRTQFAGGYQCTELLNRYWLFRWSIKWLPNGDAWTWCNSEPPSSSGIVRTTTPVHGDAIVFGKGVCGSDSTYGHVALIDTVDTERSKVTFAEQNQAGRRTSAMSCATCFLHVVANDGSSGASGAGGAGTSTMATRGGTTNGSSFVASGGRSSTPRGTSLASGGNSTIVGGASSSVGGRTTIGGASSSVGGRTKSGGTVNTTTTSRGTRASGGATVSDTGGTSNRPEGSVPAGGVEASKAKTANGTSGGADDEETEISTSGGAHDDADTSSVGGLAVPFGDGTADVDAGCSCSEVGERSSRHESLGLVALGVALLLRTGRLRQRIRVRRSARQDS